MSTTQPQNSRLHNLLVTNMALGVAVFAVAVYFMITGEYANLPMRQTTEALLNKFAIGGLLYSAVAWYIDQFARPIFNKTGVNA